MEVKLNCIMLVDDDRMTNLMNKIVIDEADCSHEVIKKDSAVSALKYLSDCSFNNQLPFPDIIFLDIQMPHLSGWDFMSHFNGLKEKLKSVPVVYFLSVLANREEQLRAAATTSLAGIYEKPLTQYIIDAVLDKHF